MLAFIKKFLNNSLFTLYNKIIQQNFDKNYEHSVQ
jgi:hypothetical protein